MFRRHPPIANKPCRERQRVLHQSTTRNAVRYFLLIQTAFYTEVECRAQRFTHLREPWSSLDSLILGNQPQDHTFERRGPTRAHLNFRTSSR